MCTYLEKSGHIPSGGSKVHIPSGGSKVHIASGGRKGHIPSGGSKVHSSDATSSNPADCFNNGKCAWTVLCICMYGYVFVCVLVFMCVPVC